MGGGIVGLATAWAQWEQNPGVRLVIIEKESTLGSHQTGRNSGVIHSGIYYKPGSLKAALCRQGVHLLIDLCEEENVPYQFCGKLIVATDEQQIPALEELYRRGIANGVQGLRAIDRHALREIEPHASGIRALHSPYTGVVDYRLVAQALGRRLESIGADLKTNHQVLGIRATASVASPIVLETSQGPIETRFLVNCAGLHSDRVARMMGIQTNLQIIPFRGEYYLLRPERYHLVKGLIYPVPDARLPFLGAHFTRMINGTVEAGPNAVLAFAREGYTKTTVSPKELAETLLYPGFRRLAKRYWKVGLKEMKLSMSKRAFAEALARLIPRITSCDLVTGPAGVRAQAVSPRGTLIDDFQIVRVPNAIHVLNAPSPGATASLAIGRYISRLIAQ